MSDTPIGEIDLHAYVDGQLDAVRRAEVEAYLAEHPQARALVQQLRTHIDALHRRYDDVLNEPIPARLHAVLQPRPMAPRIATGVAWLACGLIAGWFGHALMTPAVSPSVMFAKHALTAHVVYAAEKRHPVEVPAAQEVHLVAWLSKRLEAPIRAPDLQEQGFALLGGRLLPGEAVPLAQLMYESAGGERLTLTVKRAQNRQSETGFRFYEQGGASTFYWIDRQYGYALSGSLSKARMLEVAKAVHAALPP